MTTYKDVDYIYGRRFEKMYNSVLENIKFDERLRCHINKTYEEMAKSRKQYEIANVKDLKTAYKCAKCKRLFNVDDLVFATWRKGFKNTTSRTRSSYRYCIECADSLNRHGIR